MITRTPHSSSRISGFTLIEILTVVAIIGLLASVVLVGLGSFRTRGRDTRRIADLRATQNALELYYTKNGSYPVDSDWRTLEDTVKGAGIGVTKIPHDPLVVGGVASKPNQEDYTYDSSDDHQSYILRAQLEDNGNPALNDSFHGFSGAASVPGLGLVCANTDAKPYYCIQF